MPKFNYRILLPHLAALVIFICLIFAYFPQLLDNKSLRMDDIQQFTGMSTELADYRERTGDEALWTNSMFGGMPGYLISVVYKGNLIGHLGTIMKLSLPRPADSLFIMMAGIYFLLIVLAVRQPLALIGGAAYGFSAYNLLIAEAGHMTKIHAISWMPWVMIGIILAFNGKRIAGALITAVFLSLQIKASHVQVTYYLSFIVMFYVLAQLAYSIKYKTIPGFIKNAGMLLLAALLAILTNISALYTFYDYGKDSIRGKSELTIRGKEDSGGLDKDYALDYSYGIGESFSYMIPNVYGGASNLQLANQKEALKKANPPYREVIAQLPQYWSDTSTTGPFYAGAFICFLFVLGLFLVKGPIRWAILGASIFALLLSWGKNFEGFSVFMLENFPAYNKFRAVKMTLLITDFLIPLMAVLGLNEVVKDKDFFNSVRKKWFFTAGALTAGICLLFYLMPDTFFSFDYLHPGITQQLKQMFEQSGMGEAGLNTLMNELESVRIAVFKADALRAFLFIAAGAFIVWLYGRMRFNIVLLTAALLILVVADIWSVDKRYVNEKDFVSNNRALAPHDPSPADEAIFAMEMQADPALAAKMEEHRRQVLASGKKSIPAAEAAKYRYRALLANTHYRVLNLTAPQGIFNDAGTSTFHKSVGGYSAAKLERYQEFIELRLDSTIKQLYSVLTTARGDSALNEGLAQLHALNMLNTRYIIYSEKNPPIVNPMALGNAWFVEELREVNSADEEMIELGKIDPSLTAIVDKRFNSITGGSKNYSSEGSSIVLKDYAPNRMFYECDAAQTGLAVFSEIYYGKGWNAYVDGIPADHFRVNYLLRAMEVPQGKHQIEFRFEPQAYFTTEKIAYASSSVLILLCLAFLFLQWKKNTNPA